MKVLYIAAECKPFSKVGGVGDVAGELPPALKQRGVDVEIATPLYGSIAPEHVGKPTAEYKVTYARRPEKVTVHAGDLGGVPVHFVKNARYFEGDYGKPYIFSEPVPFKDDILRFAFFSEACLPLIEKVKPDIVHVNDWPFGYLFGRMAIEGFPQKRVLTVHNIGYQGNIWVPDIRGWDIEKKLLKHPQIGPCFRDPRADWKSVNALRLGMELADMVHTVSPTYCEEITRPEDEDAFFEGGKGLHEIARQRLEEGRLIGILNGFEYEREPTDEQFAEVLREKAEAKHAIAHAFANPEAFLLGFVGRAVEQKFRLLTEPLDGKPVLEHLLALPLNVAILATGLQEYESFIGNIAMRRFPGAQSYDQVLQVPRRSNYACTIAFDREKAGQISLGSDLFLMPSLFEPCGITQMESLSHATPPLVRATGGLVDTVKPHDAKGGTGFAFGGASWDEILRNLIRRVEDALLVYNTQKRKFRQIQKNGFRARFTWSAAADAYVRKIYQPVMDPKAAASRRRKPGRPRKTKAGRK